MRSGRLNGVDDGKFAERSGGKNTIDRLWDDSGFNAGRVAVRVVVQLIELNHGHDESISIYATVIDNS